MEEALNNSPTISKLLERAANNTEEGISISSMTLPDQPLIYLNEGFERLTGYSKKEALGKNCRFLQGERTNQREVDKIRNAIKKDDACTVELLNYRKNGKPFWNRLSITPLKNDAGEVTHYVGIQSDITELKQTKNQLEKANKGLIEFQSLITNELNQAKIAQQFLLPKLPKSSKIITASKFIPVAQIGGDFYDIIEIDKSTYGFLVADVSGHGIPAALVTFMSSTAFKNTAPGNKSTQSVVSMTNDRLYSKMPDDSFVTLFYAIYDSSSQQLKFTQAGHLPALLLQSKTRDIIHLETKDTLVGVFSKDEVQFKENQQLVQTGDRILLYTDAIVEIMDENMIQLGLDGLCTFIKDHWDLTIEDLPEAIYNFGLNRGGKDVYDDDFTMLAIEIL